MEFTRALRFVALATVILATAGNGQTLPCQTTASTTGVSAQSAAVGAYSAVTLPDTTTGASNVNSLSLASLDEYLYLISNTTSCNEETATTTVTGACKQITTGTSFVIAFTGYAMCAGNMSTLPLMSTVYVPTNGSPLVQSVELMPASAAAPMMAQATPEAMPEPEATPEGMTSMMMGYGDYEATTYAPTNPAMLDVGGGYRKA